MKKKMISAILLISVLLSAACGADTSDSTTSDSKNSDTTSNDSNYVGEKSTETDRSESYSESYLDIEENNRQYTDEDSLLTFSLKVDTASYSNTARYIESSNLPPADAVRTEELINYFSYEGDLPYTSGPFSLSAEVGQSPFDNSKHIAMVRVKTKEIDADELPSSNLTFLIDTSGSMDSYDKLPLLKEAFALLVETLDEDDRVSIVTYSGSSAVVLDSASGADKQKILKAINRLEASGSTAGADGIQTAYKLSKKNYMKNGNNRIILATDGDFNVGISDLDELEQFIAQKRDSGMYLSILGFGTGNLKDDTMETLSTNGNGNYMYINSVEDAQKGLVNEMGSNLYTVADDVKAQIEFNSNNVKSYRLIGYENRQTSDEEFDDDSKDAGEIGAGTDVVMMFELELEEDSADELFKVRIRYKKSGESESELFEVPVDYSEITDKPSSDFTFACSVVGFGHLLRDSEYAGDITIDQIIEMAEENLGFDQDGYRYDYLELLEEYQNIAKYN